MFRRFLLAILKVVGIITEVNGMIERGFFFRFIGNNSASEVHGEVKRQLTENI